MEFPAERDRHGRMKAENADKEAATKRKTQPAADPHRAKSPNETKWPLDHMSRFLSAQVESVIKWCPSCIKLALLTELTLTAS